MKKLLALLLALIITATAVSCGKKEPSDSAETSVTSAESTDVSNNISPEENDRKTDGFYTYVVKDKGAAIVGYSGLETNLEIPEKLGGYETVEIGESVFKKIFEIESVSIPDGVKKIGSGAFAETSASKIKIPESVCEIGSGAFASTPWFEALTDEFTLVGDGVCIKYNGAEKDVTVPGEAKYISNIFRYNDTEIVSVTISEGTVTIGERAFAGMKFLNNAVFPSTVEEIGKNAFTLCTSLESVTVPDTVKKLGEYVFSHCKVLKKVGIGSGIEELPDYAFFSCTSLAEAALSDELKSIGNSAFEGCTNLEKITVPEKVSKIGDSVFEGNPNVRIFCSKGSYSEKFFIDSGFVVNPDNK